MMGAVYPMSALIPSTSEEETKIMKAHSVSSVHAWACCSPPRRVPRHIRTRPFLSPAVRHAGVRTLSAMAAAAMAYRTQEVGAALP